MRSQEEQVLNRISRRAIRVGVLGAGLLLAAGISLTTGATAYAAQLAPVASSTHGCPYGDVCVYPQNTGWNGDHPSLKYYNYGCYNLSNQVGIHRVFNNQISSSGDPHPVVVGDTAYGCTSSTAAFVIGVAGTYKDINLTPVNSIELYSAA